MMRSCAHFGVKGVWCRMQHCRSLGRYPYRRSGAEHVQPITGDNIVNVLDDFRQAGYTV